VPSTGRLVDTLGMSRTPMSSGSPRTPYDNHADCVGRWSGLTEAELLAAADADPLRFAARRGHPMRTRADSKSDRDWRFQHARRSQ